jgi:1,4-alpha-glucan branching enzyme
MSRVISFAVLASTIMLSTAPAAIAQDRSTSRPPEVVSPEVSTEKKITCRLYAPKAQAVKLVGSDIPGTGGGVAMKKADNGVWEATVGPVPAGAFRYHFNLGRGGGDRSEESFDQRISRHDLEPGLCSRLRDFRYAECAARRSRSGHILF